MRAHYIHGVIPQVLIAAAITVEVLTAGILAGYLWDRVPSCGNQCMVLYLVF
ncbi:MAG: hypothetical protein Q4A82_03180 [Corynebacterium sp.]|nr:hypothetical protein [Corynebacterium sp.]